MMAARIFTASCRRFAWAVPAALFVLCSPFANAHHSPAIYDMTSVIAIQGKLVRYEWSSPHVYFWVEETKENGETVTWEVSGASPGILRRFGWTKDAVKVGDQLAINVNPGRDADRRVASMVSLKTGDSPELGSPAAAARHDGQAIHERPSSIAGTWGTVMDAKAVMPFMAPAAFLPLTDEGRTAVAAFVDAVDNPGIQCVPLPPPAMMLIADIKQVEVREDAVTIRGEFQGTTRTIHLDADSHEGATESVLGHSIGHWEGGALAIDTTHFLPHRSGNAGALPSGTQKHLTERIRLSDDGARLLYEYTVEDPEYLTKPHTGRIEALYQPAVTYEGLPCNPESARRFLR